jgi:GT2 family glycosyltransferase
MREQVVDAVSGAFMCVSHQMWREVGGLDVTYPHSGEDLELCWQVQQRGGRVVFVPDALAQHELEASVSQAPPQIDVLRWFGLIKFTRRNDGPVVASLLRLALALRTSVLLLAALARIPGARQRNVARARLLWRWALLGDLPSLPETTI